MASETIPDPPEGFVRMDGRGEFSTRNGPYFAKPREEGVVEQAFYALSRHCNGVGIVHGGMLSAFMDGVLAGAVWRGTQTRAVTIHLSLDYLHMARAGEWVRGEARLTRAARDVAFVEGRAFVGERDIVRCSGIFKLMGNPRG